MIRNEPLPKTLRMPRVVLKLGAVALLAGSAAAATAGTIVVTDFDDVIDDTDGTCTLREAVRTANGDVAVDGCSISGAAGADRIVLTAGTYCVDLATGSAEDAAVDGDLDITEELVIQGVTPDHIIIDGDADTSKRIQP